MSFIPFPFTSETVADLVTLIEGALKSMICVWSSGSAVEGSSDTSETTVEVGVKAVTISVFEIPPASISD